MAGTATAAATAAAMMCFFIQCSPKTLNELQSPQFLDQLLRARVVITVQHLQTSVTGDCGELNDIR
jgi:hypothetical protein